MLQSKSRKNIFFETLLLTITLIPSLAFGALVEEGKFYPNPGIVAFREGKWVGSDHLYNLSNKIDIVIEIFKPEKTTVPFTEDDIHTVVAEVFKAAKIEPNADVQVGKPLLPFLHVLVMLYPIDKKAYALYTEGRLFEQIEVNRVKLDDQTFMQGITWESSNLQVASADDLQKQVNKSVSEIVKIFTDRFAFYEKIKLQIKQSEPK